MTFSRWRLNQAQPPAWAALAALLPQSAQQASLVRFATSGALGTSTGFPLLQQV